MRVKLLFLLCIIFLYSFLPFGGEIAKISANLVSRQVQNGKSVTIKGEIFYQRNGNLTTHFIYPKEYVMMGNNVGETKIYDPISNTVIKYQNQLLSTQSSQFYYFLSGKVSDMGLTAIGYVQEKTKYESGLMMSDWKLKKPDAKALIQKVKLVFNNNKPVYMDYKDSKNKIIRKVYYYNYVALDNIEFPGTTTEIQYSGKDSTVSKTSYENFKTNEQANSSYFNFTIPANAKIQR